MNEFEYSYIEVTAQKGEGEHAITILWQQALRVPRGRAIWNYNLKHWRKTFQNTLQLISETLGSN